jgi:hypothetical protein
MEFVLVSAETWGVSSDIRSELVFPMELYLEGTEYLVGNLVVEEDDTLLVGKGSYFQVEELGSMQTSQMSQDTKVLVVGGNMEEGDSHAVDRVYMVEGLDTW